jgi:hypothetical protein
MWGVRGEAEVKPGFTLRFPLLWKLLFLQKEQCDCKRSARKQALFFLALIGHAYRGGQDRRHSEARVAS